jgi:hypothetical protein
MYDTNNSDTNNSDTTTNKPITKYQLFVMEQRKRANENKNDDTNGDPIESIVKAFAKMTI